jgi:hypothetical protein
MLIFNAVINSRQGVDTDWNDIQQPCTYLERSEELIKMLQAVFLPFMCVAEVVTEPVNIIESDKGSEEDCVTLPLSTNDAVLYRDSDECIDSMHFGEVSIPVITVLLLALHILFLVSGQPQAS